MSDHKRGEAIAFYTSSLPFFPPLASGCYYASPKNPPLPLSVCACVCLHIARCMCICATIDRWPTTVRYYVACNGRPVHFFLERDLASRMRRDWEEAAPPPTTKNWCTYAFSHCTKFMTHAVRLSDVVLHQKGSRCIVASRCAISLVPLFAYNGVLFTAYIRGRLSRESDNCRTNKLDEDLFSLVILQRETKIRCVTIVFSRHN